MAKRKSPVDKALEQFAKVLAGEHFEASLEMYEEEAEFLADDGVTEHEYVQSCNEHIYTDVEEGVAEQLVDLANKEYDRLVKVKYGRKRKA